MEVLEKVNAGCGLEGVLQVYNDRGYSDYLVVYLRSALWYHLAVALLLTIQYTLSVLMAIFPGEPGLAHFIGAKDDGSVYRPDALSVTNQQCQALKSAPAIS